MNKKRRNRLVGHNKLSKICQVMKLGVFLMVVFITNVTAGTLAQKTMTVTEPVEFQGNFFRDS